jgi:hypothetical protein
MADISIDHQALKELVRRMREPHGAPAQLTDWCVACGAGGGADWCVACGAGFASAKLHYPEELAEAIGKQFLDPKVLSEFVTSVREVDAKTLSQNDPAEIGDAFIDDLAQRLIRIVKVR